MICLNRDILDEDHRVASTKPSDRVSTEAVLHTLAGAGIAPRRLRPAELTEAWFAERLTLRLTDKVTLVNQALGREGDERA